MTPGLRIARQWQAEDGTISRLAELINEELARQRHQIAVDFDIPEIDGSNEPPRPLP